MIRTHVSAKSHPTPTIRPRSQEFEPAFKPTGLWWEVDGDWRRWCAGEMPQWVAGGHLYRVDLDPACRILTIDTAEGIDDFDTRFGVAGTYSLGIDWQSVAAEWDGIEIAPYQYTRRLAGGVTWYYGWDCASGCVWRPRRSSLVYLSTLPAEPAEVTA